MKWFSLLSVVLLMLAMLLFASPVAYADDPPDDADTVVDVEVDGELEVDIGVSGPAELNVGVEGPSEVHIDAGDEVRVNVQASDESQVSIDDQSLDNPAHPDEPAGYQESVVPIISGVFPAAALFAFFLIRRRAQNKVNNEGR